MDEIVNRYSLSIINTKNEEVDIVVGTCTHCNEIVPYVGKCPDCHTEYEHKKTLENPETGFIHAVYECSKCPPEKRKAQKIFRVNNGNSNQNTKDDLIKNFL